MLVNVQLPGIGSTSIFPAAAERGNRSTGGRTMTTTRPGIAFLTDPDNMTIGITGKTVDSGKIIELEGRGGMVVDGRPGAGKTVFLQSLVRELVDSGIGNVNVTDGKNGGDWDYLGDVVETVVNTDSPERTVEYLRNYEEQLNSRFSDLKTECESDRFWSMSFLERIIFGMNYEILVIDEMPEFFNDSGDDQLVDEAVNILLRLIARGGDTGCLVVLISQRQHLIPSKLRQKCSIHVDFPNFGVVEVSELS